MPNSANRAMLSLEDSRPGYDLRILSAHRYAQEDKLDG